MQCSMFVFLSRSRFALHMGPSGGPFPNLTPFVSECTARTSPPGVCGVAIPATETPRNPWSAVVGAFTWRAKSRFSKRSSSTLLRPSRSFCSNSNSSNSGSVANLRPRPTIVCSSARVAPGNKTLGSFVKFATWIHSGFAQTPHAARKPLRHFFDSPLGAITFISNSSSIPQYPSQYTCTRE